MNDVILLLGGASLARVGAMLLSMGAGRARFAGSAAIRSLLDFAVLIVAMSLARRVGLLHLNSPDLSAYAMILAGALLGGSLFPTAIAERSLLRTGLLLPLLFGLLLLPVATRLAPMLIDRDFIDDGGASIFHLTAGVLALVASLFTGPREGRFERDGSISVIAPHQLPLTLAGLLVLALAMVFTTATIATVPTKGSALLLLALAVSLLASAGYSQFRFGRVDPGFFPPGVIAALIACSPTLGRLSTPNNPLASDLHIVLTSAIAALLAIHAHLLLERKLKLDDLVGVVPAQISGSLLGLLVASLSVPMREIPGQLLVQLLGATASAATALIPSLVILLVVSKVSPLRVPPSVEYDGLDLNHHDLNAYPDFSQPMIRSHHNREA